MISACFQADMPAQYARGSREREEHHRLHEGAKGPESLPKTDHLPAGTQQMLSGPDGGARAPPAGRTGTSLLLQALQGLWVRAAPLPRCGRHHPDSRPRRPQGQEADAADARSGRHAAIAREFGRLRIEGPSTRARSRQSDPVGGNRPEGGGQPSRASGSRPPAVPPARGRTKERGSAATIEPSNPCRPRARSG